MLQFPLMIRRVNGDSMLPRLKNGDLLIASRIFKDVSVNDIVIFKHNGLEKIKRVKSLNGDNVDLRGDNEASSTDSRHFGTIDKKSIIAKKLFTL